MDNTEFKKSWTEQKSMLKQKFAALTDNDLLFAESDMDAMYSKLQIKLGKTKDELKTIIRGL